jgi:hypothetical protein
VLGEVKMKASGFAKAMREAFVVLVDSKLVRGPQIRITGTLTFRSDLLSDLNSITKGAVK